MGSAQLHLEGAGLGQQRVLGLERAAATGCWQHHAVLAATHVRALVTSQAKVKVLAEQSDANICKSLFSLSMQALSEPGLATMGCECQQELCLSPVC